MGQDEVRHGRAADEHMRGGASRAQSKRGVKAMDDVLQAHHAASESFTYCQLSAR